MTRILEMYAKSIDVHQKTKFLFTTVEPDQNQLYLANFYDAQVIVGADEQQMVTKFQGKPRNY